ncbi:bifunctional glycosyltransferase family 2 protein/CDP-glycerol:glycerophosphate glycerophosphotransferase [Leucobacter komagatae]
MRRCLDSVLGQSMGDLELIVVNDGSTDGTREILAEYEASDARVTAVDQPNAGQGAARNRALGQARGDFVLFVDADDFIERVTLQVTTERAVADESDLVHFDWKLYTPGVGRPGDVHYYNADPFWHKRVLVGIECDELLRVQNFYSVTKLYRRSFLDHHEIRFEEGRIYEDNPFVLQAVNRADRASLVHSPLYTIDPHPESSTRSHTDTDKHVRDHLYAVRRTFELLDRRNPRAAAYLAAYHVKKIGPYYERRIPKRFRRAYVREFVQILHDADVVIPDGTSTNAPTRLAVRLKMFERNRATLFETMVAGKNVVMPRYKRAKRWAKRIKHRNSKDSAWSSALERALAEPIMPGTITFLGLDFKYTGNSRYLFEELLEDPRFANFTIRFVTADERVPPQYRLDPASPETYTYLARTKLLLAESWIPPRVRKHRDSTWVQLWHGTPLKRMLFDSHEPRIIWNKRHHKINKYRDILNWDYLVVDSPAAAEKFETAFLFDPEKMIRSGYPRVEYLLKQRSETEPRDSVRRQLCGHDHEDKSLVLYVPTWRDVNYGRQDGDFDYEYVLDVAKLADELGEDFVVAFHDHGYLATSVATTHPRCVDASTEEIQDLLLAADAVITDYSSVLLDADALGLPTAIFAADLAQFEEYRGIYSDFRGTMRRGSEVVELVSRATAGEECDKRRASEFSNYRNSELLRKALLDVLPREKRKPAPAKPEPIVGETT